MAEQAARLCKADLVSGMVGEFPELQGVMGGYYARAEGYPDEVADAIRDHYKPVGQGDEVPTAPVTVAVSLADKLDTLTGFFSNSLLPTGSKDPFALRRAAVAIIQQWLSTSLRTSLESLLLASSYQYYLREREKRSEQLTVDAYYGLSRAYGQEPATALLDEVLRLRENELDNEPFFRKQFRAVDALLEFFADRLKVQQREAGVRHDLIDAVFALGGEDDLVRLLARVNALQAFVGTAEGANLLAGYKRAANILRKEGWVASSPEQEHSVPVAPAEAALVAALDEAEPGAEAAIAAEDFEGAMAALASLRAPIDAFFEHVIVNDPDPATRGARLGLLARVRDAVHRVADFSKIEG